MTISTCRANTRSRGIFAFATPGPAGKTVYLKRREFSDPNLTFPPRASIPQSAPEKTIPTWPVAVALLLIPLAPSQATGKSVQFLKAA